MSRDLTAALKQAIYSSSTEEAFLVLLEITHASLSEPVRVTSDAVATTHDSLSLIHISEPTRPY